MNAPRKPPVDSSSAEPEKLHKVLARAGLGSRRELEKWIQAGRVSVNGQLAHVGQRISAADKIRVDGRDIAQQAREEPTLRVLLYHKPAGEICTRKDEQGRPTVFDSLPNLPHGRWMSVGRLDFNTTGLLLFSNSGTLVHKLMHPATGMEREYAVRVLGEVGDESLAALKAGVHLDGVSARFKFIVDTGGEGVNHWYRVVLEEGRNREVHRLWETQGITVSRLSRIRYGHIELPRSLRTGRWAELTGESLQQLLERVDLASLMPPSTDRPGVRALKGAPRRARGPGTQTTASKGSGARRPARPTKRR
jgi:23S rRNA pseudouridine2605 synthase